MSGFCNILAYRITVSSLRGFLAVRMTAGIVTLAGGAFRRAVRGGLAYTMRGGLSLVMVNPMPGGRCRRLAILTGASRTIPAGSAQPAAAFENIGAGATSTKRAEFCWTLIAGMAY